MAKDRHHIRRIFPAYNLLRNTPLNDGGGTLTDFLSAVGSLATTKDFGGNTLDKIGFGDVSAWMDGKVASGYHSESLGL